MATLKDLQEMVKSGEFSKKLLEDEKFKTEIKKILEQEDGIEITDKDVPEIVEELAKSLTQNPDEKVLSEENLENISGGVSKAKVIKGVSTIVGGLMGAGIGYKAGNSEMVENRIDDTEEYQKASDNYKAAVSDKPGPFEIKYKRFLDTAEGQEFEKVMNKYKKKENIAAAGSAVAGGVGGLGAGYWISDYLCKKFDIK